MPTLLSSTSTRPQLARQASTIALTWALLDASHSKAAASPPSLAIRPTVSSAAARLRSTQKTRAPSRAKVTAVHLPLPQPGPLEPAPTTIATLSFNLPAMRRSLVTLLLPANSSTHQQGEDPDMKIAIIGAGNVGKALAGRFAKAGHEIVFGVRDPAAARNAALPHPALRTAEAAATADAVVLSTSWAGTEAACRAM